MIYGAIPTATNKDAARFYRERARQSFNRALDLPNGGKADDIVKKQAREDSAKL